MSTGALQALDEQAAALAAVVSAAVDEVGHQSDKTLLESVDRIGEINRLVEGLGAVLAGEIERRSAADRSDAMARKAGEKSATILVAIHAGIEPAEAREWCRVGVAIAPRMTLQGEPLPPERPSIADAVTSGRIAVSGAARIVETLDRIAPLAPADDPPRVESFLVEQAERLTPRNLARLCRAIPDRYDPDGAQPREDLLRSKAGIWVTQGRDGMTRWTVVLHPEAAGFANAALDARTAPRREPVFTDVAAPDPAVATADSRTLAQRRLDAFVGILRESLHHDSGTVSGRAVTMVVTVGLESLLSGIGTAKIAGIDEPISAATARRLAAQADIIPMVLGTPSQPLDCGRAVRLATEAQRVALAVRDEGCIWPGCNAPPGWCEVAHILAWILGGETDLENLVLLCPFHHRRFDIDGWTLQWQEGVPYLVPPAWIDATRAPRRAGRLPSAA